MKWNRINGHKGVVN